MIEFVVITLLVAVSISMVSVAHRRALRRSRLRAEAMLDDLAAVACAVMAAGHDPCTSRRGARAVDRYARTGDRVAAARSRHELDALVARHRLRVGAQRTVTRGLERVRDLIAEAVPARR